MGTNPWFKRRGGRSLIGERARRRPTSIGPCPSCGYALTAPSEHWVDAESVVTAHLLCCTADMATTAEPVARPLRAFVRPA
jgi:hypothetical protein